MTRLDRRQDKQGALSIQGPEGLGMRFGPCNVLRCLGLLLFVAGGCAQSTSSAPDAAVMLGEIGVIEARAERGDVLAQYQLGLSYAEGYGVVRDEARAVYWYRKAADQGFADAQNDLGAMYARGRGVKQDFAEALHWYRKASEQGQAEAQNSIGTMYALGQGVTRDDAEAIRWFRKAADQGFALAQNNLGAMYAEGRGVAQDGAEAVRWMSKAAEQRLAEAQCNLGELYDLGKGVPRNAEEAHFWYALAATLEGTGELHDEAVKSRDRLAAQLMPTQISEAQKKVHTWQLAHPVRPHIASSSARVPIPTPPPWSEK